MKHKIKSNGYKEIEIAGGYYQNGYERYSIIGENVIKICLLSDYASLSSGVNEFDRIDEAVPITKDQFEADLETAFEIIRGKLVTEEVEIEG